MKADENAHLLNRNALRGLALGCVLAFAFLCGAHSALGKESAAMREAKIRAGFLYHLAKLVTWDMDRFQDDKSPIIAGFLGDSMPELPDYFASQAPSYKAQNRNIIVKRLALPAPDTGKAAVQKRLSEIQRCHILYVPRDMEQNISKYPELLNTKGMLVVGETRGFTEKRGMIGLEIVKEHIVIFVNRGNVKRAELAISAQFLQHAIQVDDKSGGAGQKGAQEQPKH